MTEVCEVGDFRMCRERFRTCHAPHFRYMIACVVFMPYRDTEGQSEQDHVAAAEALHDSALGAGEAEVCIAPASADFRPKGEFAGDAIQAVAVVQDDPTDDPSDWPSDDAEPLNAQPPAPDQPTSLQLAARLPIGPDKGARPGPRSKLTRAKARVIVTAIREGNYQYTAAALAGISRQTLDQWLTRGETEPGTRYALLADAMRQAEAEHEADALSRIQAAGAKDWKATATILGRRYRDRWAEQTIQNDHGAKVQVNIGIALPAPGTVALQLVDNAEVSVLPPLIE